MLHPHHLRDVDGDVRPSPPAARRTRTRSRAWACLAALLAVAGLTLASGPQTAAETAQEDGIEVLGHIGGASYAIASDAGRAFAATGAAVHIFDAGPGQRPREVGRPLVLPGLIIDMQTADGLLFVVTTHNDGFWIADTSDPGGPRIVGSAGDLVNPQRAFAANGLAYVLDLGDSAATDDQALVIFDVTAPSQPRAVGRLRLPDVGRTSLLDVVVASELAYVALECSSGAECTDLHAPVIDVSDPARPVQVARFDGGAQAIAAGDQHV